MYDSRGGGMTSLTPYQEEAAFMHDIYTFGKEFGWTYDETINLPLDVYLAMRNIMNIKALKEAERNKKPEDRELL